MNRKAWLAIASVGVLLMGCSTSTETISPSEESTENLARWQNPQTPGEKIAAEVFKAHGGAGWEQVEHLSFRFVVQVADERIFEAQHHWNVRSNLNRVIWEDEEGAWDVVVNLDTKVAVDGTLNGEAFQGEERMQGGRRAHRRWINDSYWLLMPIKMLDDGVKPRDEPRIQIDDEWVDVVSLSFESVGLTPDDRYWVYIDPETHRILGWDMVLESDHQAEPRFIKWISYEEYGPLILPTERLWKEGDRAIFFEDISVEINDVEVSSD